MELLRGTASHVHATSRVSSSGTGDSLSVFTRFICSFSLDGHQVQITGSHPPVVHPGDDVVVVGERQAGGVVRVTCYINVTRGVGNTEQGPFLWLVGGTLAMVFSMIVVLLQLLVLALSRPDEIAGDLGLAAVASTIFGLVGFLSGSWMLRRGRRISKALRMMREASKAALRR